MIKVNLANLPAELHGTYRALAAAEASGVLSIDDALPGYLQAARERARLLRARPELFPAAQRKALALVRKDGGVGTEIKLLLSTFRITGDDTCGCANQARAWDRRGVEWCAAHRDDLVAYLVEQGKRRSWWLGIGARLSAPQLVDMAIENARRRRGDSPTTA